MDNKDFLVPEKTGLWIMDMQERLFPHVERCCEVLERIVFSLKAGKLLGLSVMVTEQYPEGLGNTIEGIKKYLPSGQTIYSKTAFSGYTDPLIRKAVDKTGVTHWILVGIEAHICILQSAKDLLKEGKKVIIPNDAISSRSIFDYSTAIGELKDLGARISSVETLFYEMIRDAKHPKFKEFLPMVRLQTVG